MRPFCGDDATANVPDWDWNTPFEVSDSEINGENSAAKCATLCFGNGYFYAALQNG